MNTDPLRLEADWHYEQAGERWHYLVQAWVGDELAGRTYGWFEPGHRFVLEKIELDPPHRSKGFGTRMIGLLRSKARAEACVDFVIQGVMATNRRAIRLYESLGAHAVSTVEDRFDYVISPP